MNGTVHLLFKYFSQSLSPSSQPLATVKVVVGMLSSEQLQFLKRVHLARTSTHPLDFTLFPGWSPFPGNINQLVLKLGSYTQQLERTGGVISEFVNPKWVLTS